jgi:hypothetical protein
MIGWKARTQKRILCSAGTFGVLSLCAALSVGTPSALAASTDPSFGVRWIYSSGYPTSGCPSCYLDGTRASLTTPVSPFFTTPSGTVGLERVAAEGFDGHGTPRLIQAGFLEGANKQIDNTCGPSPTYYVELRHSASYYTCTEHGSASPSITHKFAVRQIDSNTWHAYIDDVYTNDSVDFVDSLTVYAGGEISTAPAGPAFDNSDGNVWARVNYDSGCCSSNQVWQKYNQVINQWQDITGSHVCNYRGGCPVGDSFAAGWSIEAPSPDWRVYH